LNQPRVRDVDDAREKIMPNTKSTRQHKVSSALIALGAVLGAGGLGSLATIPNIPTWYAGLNKPFFTPPNFLFGPVWTVLYALMGVAFWRILTLPENRKRNTAVSCFVVQAVLNGLWSFAFFGFHSPLAGLVTIVALIIFVVLTIITFARQDRPAAWLLAPYLAWICYAAALNAAVFLLNR
jgi:tryptophan-rich sensory protein